MNRTTLIVAGVLSGSRLLLVDAAFKGTVLLALAGVAVTILRRDSAATRHFVWLLAMVTLLVVPILSAVLPQWQVLPGWTKPQSASDNVPAGMSNLTTQLFVAAEVSALAQRDNAESPNASGEQFVEPPIMTLPLFGAPESLPDAPKSNWEWLNVLPFVWAVGFSVLILRLAAARWILWTAQRGSTVVSSVAHLPNAEMRLSEPAEPPAADHSARDPMNSVFRAACWQLSISGPITLLIHPARTIPVVWGIFRSYVLLPETARNWNADQLRSVLLHELAHVKRRDMITQLATQFACALHWFNPLVWFAAWRLGVERERSCDDLVLASGVRPSAYAGHLLEIVTDLAPARWTQSCGLAMARKSSLEGRLVAVLSETLNRRSVSLALAIVALVIAGAIAVPIAMLHADDEQPAKSIEQLQPDGSTSAPVASGETTANDELQGPQSAAVLPGRLFVNAGLRTTRDEKRFSQSAIAINPNTGSWTRLHDFSESGFTVPLTPVRVSPDGRTMLFMKQNEIWKCDATTGENAARAFSKGQPKAWSPDGKEFIAVVGHESGGSEGIENWRVSIDGQKQSLLSLSTGDVIEDWSADGRWLAAWSHADAQIYVMQADGSGRAPLTKTDGNATRNEHPRFSPDGRRIVYLQTRYYGDARQETRYSLRTINVDGADDREILGESPVGPPETASTWTAPMSARWSPDGKHLAVIRFDHQRDGGILAINGNWRLAILDANGHNLRELQFAGVLNTVLPWDGPEWRPAPPSQISQTSKQRGSAEPQGIVFISRGTRRPIPIFDAGEGVTWQIDERIFHGADVITTVRLRYTTMEGMPTGHDINLAMDAFANREKWALAWLRGTKTIWHVNGGFDGRYLRLYRTVFDNPNRIVTDYEANYPGEPIDGLGISDEMRARFEQHVAVTDPKVADKSGGLPEVSGQFIHAAQPVDASGNVPVKTVPASASAKRWMVRFVEGDTGKRVPVVRVRLRIRNVDGSHTSDVTRLVHSNGNENDMLNPSLEADQYAEVLIEDPQLTDGGVPLRYFGNVPAHLPESQKHTDSATPFIVKLWSRTQNAVKLRTDIEERLQWGQPVNGLRAALIRPQALGEPAADEVFDFKLVVQNVTDSPIVFSAANAEPKNNLLKIKRDGQTLSAINDSKPFAADITLQPGNVAVLRLFLSTTKGSSITAGVPAMTFSAEITVDNAPAGAWTGKLITADTGGTFSAYGLQPKHKAAQALFRTWYTIARGNGDIPGAVVGQLADSVKLFTKNNPTWDTTPQLLKMLPRFDATHDWSGLDALALLDELAAVQTTPIEMAADREFEQTMRTGIGLPRELAGAPWGPALPNGLRLAWRLEPSAAEHPLNTPLKSRILIHNSGKTPVVFRSRTWHQSANHRALDSQGRVIKVESTYWTTLARLVPFRLWPGEFVELTAAGIGVGANRNNEDWQNSRVGAWIDATAGEEVTFTPDAVPLSDWNEESQRADDPQWWIEFIKARLSRHMPFPHGAEDRKRLLYLVAMELFGNPVSEEINAAFIADQTLTALDSVARRLAKYFATPYVGSLQSGPTTFRVLPVDLQAANKPRTAKDPGNYTLGPSARLVVTRRPMGERIGNEARIVFYSPDGKVDPPGKPFTLELPDGYNTWAAAWQHDGTVLWLQQPGMFLQYDFTDPAHVKVETLTEPAAVARIPKLILNALENALKPI